MTDGLYKIVFKGEIGLDFDESEVKSNLRKQCGFDEKTIERLFSGGSFILKKDIDQATAQRYRETLQRLGALCDVLPMIAPPPAVPEPPPEAPGVAAVAAPLKVRAFTCPACGRAQEKSETCVACGIIFAKHERAQNRLQERDTAIAAPVAPTGRMAGPGRVAAGRPAAPAEMRDWLLPSVATLCALAVLQLLLKRELMVLGALLLPFAFLTYLLLRSLLVGRGMFELLLDHAELETGPGERSWRQQPWWTYGLIVAHLVLYYAFAVRLEPERLAADFAFLPAAGGAGQAVSSLFSALFLHADGWQLWGSVVFLWIAGSAAERRLGGIRFAPVYLLSGLLYFAVAAGAHQWLLGAPLHAVGSSGAIAGLLGLLLATGRGGLLSFSPPLLGWITEALPTAVTLRLAAPLVIGLFFYANLSSLTDPDQALFALLVGHLAHLAAFAAGVLGGLLLVPAEPVVAPPRVPPRPR